MAAPYAKLAEAVQANITGQGDFVRIQEHLRESFADPDALLDAVLSAQRAHPDRLRGLCRAAQKFIERGGCDAS